MLALVDVNNFYASCEQLFDPQLRGRPLVVLSNNDGCVVARSAEARAIGVPMAAPWHHVRPLIERHGGTWRSSNYALYADMSDRVAEILSRYSPEVEVYSIDESFLGMDGFRDRAARGRAMRRHIRRWLGLSVCVGIAETKTLAKLANHFAKKRAEFDGVCDLAALAPAARERLLADTEVGQVWGVGRRLTARLNAMGIHTVADLVCADTRTLRERFSVGLDRTVRELRGTPCLDLEPVVPDRKEIISSRTFGGYVRDLPTLQASLAGHAARAAEKLRAQESVAALVCAFIRTNPFRKGAQYQSMASIRLPAPTADTVLISRAALCILERGFRPGFDYRKAGVMLGDISPAHRVQGELFGTAGQARTDARQSTLNATLDRINRRWGRGTARMLVEAAPGGWQMARNRLSPSYTTRWSEVAGVG